MKQKLVTLIDNVGRYIIGAYASEDKNTISISSPMILNVQPDPQSGKLHIQTLPLFFKEFLKPESQNIWVYDKSSVVVGMLDLDDKIVAQYNSIANPTAVTQDVNDNPKVIKISDFE